MRTRPRTPTHAYQADDAAVAPKSGLVFLVARAQAAQDAHRVSSERRGSARVVEARKHDPHLRWKRNVTTQIER